MAALTLLCQAARLESAKSASIELCAERDPKGLYGRSKAGALNGLNGIDSQYEEPLAPNFRVDAAQVEADDAAEMIVHLLAT
jgi:adenylylsulfate kinase-like enzyme